MPVNRWFARWGCGVAWVLLLGSAARADRAPVRVGVYTLDDDPPELADALDAAAEHAISRHAGVALIRIGELAQPSPQEMAAALQRATDDVTESNRHFEAGEVDEAKRLLENALQGYQRVLPELIAAHGRAPLVDAWSRLARARYFAGDQDGAKAALAFVFALEPKTVFDKALFGAPLEHAVIEAKLTAEMLGPGQLSPESDPPGAEILLDGSALEGRSPLANIACSAGPHYITYRRRGYLTQTAIFSVQGGGQTQTAVRSLERATLIRPFYREQALLPSGAVDLAAALDAVGVDELVLVRALPVSGGLELHAYRVRHDGRVSHVQQVSPEASAPLDVETLVDNVLDARAHTALVAQPTESAWRRFRRWPGFWYVVGGAGALVVAGAVGVGVGVGARSPSGEQVLILGR